MHDDDVRRARQPHGVGHGNLHRQGRQCDQPRGAPAQVRRDRARGDRSASRAPARSRRLVHETGALGHHRRGCDLGTRGMPPRDVRRARLRHGVVQRELPRQRRNVSSRAFALKFDATPPPVVDLKAATGDRSVALSWETTPDAESVAVVRTPGVPPEPATVVFRGPGTKFADGSVDNGVRYAYEVRVQDAAGNAGSDSVVAIPSAPPISGGEAVAPGQGVATTGATPPATDASGPRLLAPAAGAVFSRGHPPLLRWMPVPQARYYNVQLFRDSRKILSTWPKRPRYRLTNRWSYRGKQRRLVPGEYRWLVWPGFGPRSKADYGRRMGPRGFEITRSRGVTRAAEQL